MYARALMVLLALSVGACSVTPAECDPRNADIGFITKFNCSSQGVYDQRVEQKQRTLQQEQQANQLFRDTYRAIEQQQWAVSQDLATQQRQSAELNRSLNALLADLKRRAANNQKAQKEIAGLEQQMKNVNQQQNASVMQKQVQLQQLRTRLSELEGDLGLR